MWLQLLADTSMHPCSRISTSPPGKACRLRPTVTACTCTCTRTCIPACIWLPPLLPLLPFRAGPPPQPACAHAEGHSVGLQNSCSCSCGAKRPVCSLAARTVALRKVKGLQQGVLLPGSCSFHCCCTGICSSDASRPVCSLAASQAPGPAPRSEASCFCQDLHVLLQQGVYLSLALLQWPVSSCKQDWRLA